MSFLNSYAHDLGGGSDPFFSSVSLLAHFDNNFTDSSRINNTFTPFSSPNAIVTSSTHSKFGGFAAYESTQTHGGIWSSNAAYALGTGDHTIEFWVYLTDVTTGQNLIDFRTASNQPRPVIYVTGGTVRYFSSNADRITSGASAISINTWTAICLCRASGVSKLFVQGSQVGSNFSDTENCPQTSISLSVFNTAVANMKDGYMDELRVTKGIARYTSNYTPATVAFPNF